MSNDVKLTITGAKELDAVLRTLSRRTANKFLTRALRFGAKIIQAEAKADAPSASGAVRQSIKVRAGKREPNFKSILVTSGEEWFKGPEFYAAFLEFGHRVGRRSLGDSRKKVPGLHFLQRAAERKRQAAVDAVAASLKNDVESLNGTSNPAT